MNALDHALQPIAGLRLSRMPRATPLCLEMLHRVDDRALIGTHPTGADGMEDGAADLSRGRDQLIWTGRREGTFEGAEKDC